MTGRAPRPKVVAGTIAGAVTVIVVWAAGRFGLEMPPEVAAATTTVLAFGAGYLQPDR